MEYDSNELKEFDEYLNSLDIGKLTEIDYSADDINHCRRMKNGMLLAAFIPPISISAYKLITGQMPDTSDLDSAVKYFYTIDYGDGGLTFLSAVTSVVGSVMAPLLYNGQRLSNKDFKKLTGGYKLTKEVFKAITKKIASVKDMTNYHKK